jgi:hypothetical protein
MLAGVIGMARIITSVDVERMHTPLTRATLSRITGANSHTCSVPKWTQGAREAKLICNHNIRLLAI